MDIKLNARLSAYSKIDNSTFPDCDHEHVTKEQIDELFKDTDQPTSVTKNEIDELFTETDEPLSVTKDQIDNLFEEQDESNITSVSYSEIDSLFK